MPRIAPIAAKRPIAALLLSASLAGCNVYTATPLKPYVPDIPPMEEADSPAGFNCFEAGTVTEDFLCASPALSQANKRLFSTLHARLRDADIFGRDALLAHYRAWLIGLPAQCNLPATRKPGSAPDADTTSCLLAQFASENRALTYWQNPPSLPAREAGAMADYIRFKTDMQKDPGLCTSLASALIAHPTRDRGIDVAQVPGITPIAGSHAPAAEGQALGHRIKVELYSANVFASYARRARSTYVDGTRVLDPLSLGQLIQAQNDNLGGRFSAFASQTNDYGAVDVFLYQNRLLAFIADPWGFYTPAAAGESARAGVWELGAGPAAPLCLFSTYQAPATRDAFAAMPNFTAWRDLIEDMRGGDMGNGEQVISETARREASQLRRETEWLVINMPLLVRAQNAAGGWTPWLRKRHDEALDALAAWSDQSPANKQKFNALFARMKPAAQEFLTFLQQTQGLDATEAKEATAIAMMELLYGATVAVAPDLGSDLNGPGAVAGYQARYPIIAAPQS